jgi:hypothetical protein
MRSHGLIIVAIYSARETFPCEGDTENAFYEEGERYATFFLSNIHARNVQYTGSLAHWMWCIGNNATTPY